MNDDVVRLHTCARCTGDYQTDPRDDPWDNDNDAITVETVTDDTGVCPSCMHQT